MAPAARVRAFSDPVHYDLPTDEGGGAGRWFTGSSADGFGCDVCHTGGAPVELSVSGLPLDGFTPGTAYEVVISWPPALENLSLIAEFTDEQHQTAGSLALPRMEAYEPPELCAPDEGGFPAAMLYPSAQRELIGVVDCGAKLIRVQWTAPAVAPGTIWFNAGFVASNDDQVPTGDGVTLARRALPPLGTAGETRIVAQGCRVGPGTPRNWGLAPTALLVLLGLGRGRCGCFERRLS